MKKNLLLTAALCMFSSSILADHFANYMVEGNRDNVQIFRIDDDEKVLLEEAVDVKKVFLKTDAETEEYHIGEDGISVIISPESREKEGDVSVTVQHKNGRTMSRKLTGAEPEAEIGINNIPEEIFIQNIVPRIENPANLALASKKMNAMVDKSELSLRINKHISFDDLITKLNEWRPEKLAKVKALSVEARSFNEIPKILAFFPNLTSLDLSNNISNPMCLGMAPEAIFEAIAKNCPYLEFLYLKYDKHITEKVFEAIAENCPHLKVRFKIFEIDNDLSFNDLITALKCWSPKSREHVKTLSSRARPANHFTNAQLLKILAFFPHLKFLDLKWGKPIPEKTFEAIAENWPNLKIKIRFEIFEINKAISFDDLITELKCWSPKSREHLKTLIFQTRPANHFTNTQLLEILTFFPNLRRLNLSYCKKITDAGIVAIAEKCKHLIYLNLLNSGVTYQGAKKLKVALPRCKIRPPLRWYRYKPIIF